jgi:hypothetical protein
MQPEGPLAVVRAWLDCANRQDGDRLLELSEPSIELIGPRGSGRGHQLLRDWLGRAGLSVETQRVFARGDVVVVAQHGVWHSLESGKVTDERDLACLFRVDGQRVVQFARYDSLDEAMRVAGFNDLDEVPGVGER